MNKYQKPEELYDGLRLHQNENTGGCSPKVLEALASLRADQVGFYPPYEAATRVCAAYLDVDPDRLSLLNGLDEGIMALAVGYLRPAPGGSIAEAIVPEPAFEIFAFDTEVVGARPVRVAPNPDFSFPTERVLEAITPRTRVVFLTNPNNPTGVRVPAEAIRAIARGVPPEAVVFVDEAYVEFSGDTFIPELPAFPNVIVGRTFSKAFGLAGLRIGAVTGTPEALEPIRLAVPVYSVNIAAVVAVQAALQDRAHLEDYLRQVE
jgi:histidinol-phosphate aminotransferase